MVIALRTAQVAPELTDAVLAQAAAEVVRDLVEILTRPLVASLTGVSATRYVSAWERGGTINERREIVLRTALQAARVLLTRFDAATARVWFRGQVTALGDRSPNRVLRSVTEGKEPEDSLSNVLAAARAFINF